MANSNKNLVITPNIGSANDPNIVFSGADASTAAQNITLTAYPTNGGTLSFDGSAGQLFSVTNSMSGTIFSANDVSGIPSMEILDTGLVKIAQYSGNVLLGTSTDTGLAKLQIVGSVSLTGSILHSPTGRSIYGPNPTWSSYLYLGGDGVNGITRTASIASVVTTNGNVHIDSGSDKTVYLNYYSGTGGTIFGNGASGVAATLSAAGLLSLSSNINLNTNQYLQWNGSTSNSITWDTVAVRINVIGGLRARFDAGGTTLGVDAIGSNKLNVSGNMSVGSGYVSNAAPTDGLIVQGNVGIGTTSPSQKLEVGNFLDAVTNKITVSARYEYEPEFNFRLGQSGTGYDWIGAVISSGDDGSYNGKISFKTANAGRDTPTTKMVIKASGNVGIGTTTPKGVLDLNFASYANPVGLTDVSIGALRMSGNGGLTAISSRQYDSINQPAGGDIQFLNLYYNGSTYNWYETMRVRANGNVGIGTISPDAMLHAVGGIAMSAGWNRTMTLEATYPSLVFKSNASKWAAIMYDYSSALLFRVGATSNDVTGSGVTALSIAAVTGAATFGSTVSATNLSGTNTGDQTTISGNAATATTLAAYGGVSFTTDSSGFHVINAESTSGNVRVGAAWNRPGIYNGSGTTSGGNSNSITIGSEDSIYFLTANVERGRFDSGGIGYATSSFRAPIFYDRDNTAYYVDPASTSNLNILNIGDGNLELYKSVSVDMSNVAIYSVSNYYPVTINIGTEGCIIQIQNNLNTNVPSWSTHSSGFTLNLRWRTNGAGWGTTEVRRYIEQYHERYANQTICGGITQMTNNSTEVVWLRGGGFYSFKLSRDLSPTPRSTAYTVSGQTVTPTSAAQNTIWNSASGTSLLYTEILYDYNNTTYYCDPASTSNLNAATFAGAVTANGVLSVVATNGSGAQTSKIQGGSSGGDYGILSFQNGATVRGRIVADASATSFRFDTGGTTNTIDFLTGTGYTTALSISGTTQAATFAGAVTVNGTGTSTISSATTGAAGLLLRNTAAGTGNYGILGIGNDSDANAFNIITFSSTYSGSGANTASFSRIENNQASAGLNLVAGGASGTVNIYAGGESAGSKVATFSATAATFAGAVTATGLLTANAGALVSWTGGAGLTVNRTDGAGFINFNQSNGVNGAQIGTTNTGALSIYTNLSGSSVNALVISAAGAATFAGAVTANGLTTINATGLASSPTLRLNTSSTSTFVHSQESLAANLTAGQHIISVLGKSADTKNSGYIGYTWAGNASDSNYVTIGHWGANDLFRVYGDGTATVGANTVLHAGNYTSYSMPAGSSATNSVDVRAPIFYDSNDTSYYVNPNSFSQLSYANLNASPSGRTLSLGGDQLDRVVNDSARSSLVINALYYPHLYINATSNTNNVNHGAVFSMSGNLTAGGYRRWGMGIANTDPDCFSWGYYDNEINPHYGVGGTFGYATTNSKMWLNTSGSLWTVGDMRAPVFYDSNNTAYYCDPAGTSIVNRITARASGISLSSSNSSQLEISNAASGACNISFHRENAYGAHFGLDTDNVFSTLGWSAGGGYTGMRVGAFTANGTFAVNNGWSYVANNYGYGIVGLYDSNVFQLVFAMGNAYKTTAGGGISNLYGIAWSHPNAGGIAANLSTHGALFTENGAFMAAISGSIRCRDDVRAPLYYDSANTAYYLDPASTGNSLLVAGSVGIGTTSPNAKLHVAKSASSLQNVGDENTLLQLGSDSWSNTYGGQFEFRERRFSSAVSSGHALALYGKTAANANLVADTFLLTIQSNGNVGVGTTSPGALLEIGTNATATTGLIVHGGDGGSGTTIANFLKNGGGSAVHIQGHGNVGIGTTNAAQALSLGDAKNLSFQNTLGGTGTYGAIYSYNALVNITTPATAIRFLRDVASIGPDGAIALDTNNTERLRITSAGNVGIGTASPVSKLHVAGAGNTVGGNIHMGDNTNAAGKWTYLTGAHYNGATNPTGVSIIGSYSDAGQNAVVIGGSIYEAHPATNIQFWTHTATTHTTGGSERMRIDTSGNVGMGTTSPGSKLSVAQDMSMGADLVDNTAQMVIQGTTTPGKKLMLGYDTNGNGFGFIKAGNLGVAWTNLALQPNSGNVGIGTTSPTHKLHLSTGFLATSFGMGYTPSAWARGYGGVIMAGSANSDGSGWSYGGRIVEVDEGDGMNMAFDVNYTNSWTNNAMVVSGRSGRMGNVGIGTASPSQKLDVQGTAYASSDFRAPVFYDSNDTSYYVDPNSSSQLSSFTAATYTRMDETSRKFNRQAYTGDTNYWTGTRGWGAAFTWDTAWSYGFGGFDIWGSSTGHPQGSGYIHAQGIQSGLHYASSDGSAGYGWQLVGGDGASSRLWMRGKWGSSTTAWYELAMYDRNVGTGNLYANVFYDSANTGYYLDPAATSYITSLTVTNTISGSVNGTAAALLTGSSYQVNSFGVGTAASGTAGEIRATNNITAYYSDDRLKTKLGLISDPIEKVKSLSGFYFEANETAVALGYTKQREVGVSAQEVQAILPEIIAPAPIDAQYMTVRYEKLIPLLVEAIKAQQVQIEELKAHITIIQQNLNNK